MIAEYNRLAPPDVLVCFSNSGNNAATVDMALAAHEMGLPVIALPMWSTPAS